MPQNSLKSDTARAYRKKYGKEMAMRKLARIMYKENKALFTNEEDARGRLRYIEGKSGSSHKKSVLKSEFLIEEDRPKNPYKLPDSDEEIRKPFKLPLLNNNILIISDLHIPYHNINAITLAFEYGLQHKVNTIFINGDLIDSFQLSRFEKDPRKRKFAEELELTRQFLQSLRTTFPKASIYYLKGNHCVRLEHYLMSKAKELIGVDDFLLENLLKCNEYKITVIDDKVLVKMGKLSVTHGHHIIKGIFAPVNSARGTFLKTKQSTLIAHTHKPSEHSEMTLDGELITCWAAGCLCQLLPDYTPLVNNYALGFVHVMVHKDGNYSVKNLRVYNNQIL